MRYVESFKDPVSKRRLRRAIRPHTVGRVSSLRRRRRSIRDGAKHQAADRNDVARRVVRHRRECRACGSRVTGIVGDVVSARHSFLRASEYFRQSYYFVRSDLEGRRIQESYRSHVSTFLAALELMDHRAEQVRIPYDGTSLVGYFYAPDDTAAKRPTLLFPCGYDSTAEAGWVNVPPALERNYNVVVFEGPGQGDALFNQGMHFRSDFEHVVTPLLDWLLTRREVDPEAVVLIGRSFAGYLAPRAAAFEHRLAALVVDPAQPDMAERLPSGVAAKLAGPVVKAQMRLSAERREFFDARMAAHGISDINSYFAELRRFNMLDVAAQISCPTLIIEAEHDFAGGSGQTLKDAMTTPAHLVHLSAEQGAEGHCGGLGQEVWAEVVYGWLQETLRK
jgi:pimeloyl-ACP methyl ester carboxylesterase